MILFILTLGIIFSFGLALFCVNYLYRRTNAYSNELMPANKLAKVPNHLKFVNFGSTYAMYAFNCYEELQLNAFSFAMNAQSIEIDNVLLRKYKNNIDQGATVVFCLGACVPYYRYHMVTDKRAYYEHLLLKELPQYSLIDHFTHLCPVTYKTWRKIKKIIKDDSIVSDITHNYPYNLTEEQKIKNMSNMANGWIKLFVLNDLKSDNVGKLNKENLRYNAILLRTMIEFCIENKWKPVFVIPPFSAELNQYFSDDFIKAGLYELMKPSIKEFNVPVYDYRMHKEFQHENSLFCDGGFRLSKFGSLKFTKMLLSQIDVSLNNSILRKE